MYKIVRKNERNHKKLTAFKDVYEIFSVEDNDKVSINTVEGRGRFEGVTATSNFYYFVYEGALTLEFEQDTVTLEKGDSIWIHLGEKYDMDGNYKVLMVCELAFTD